MQIYYNQKVKEKIEIKIFEKCSKNKIHSIFLEQKLQRFSELKTDFLLTEDHLKISQAKTPKLQTEINLPVIHLQKIPSKSPIHKYFSAYTLTHPEHYKIIKNRGGSGGSDLHDRKSAKIKAFAEAIERYHSSYLSEDILKNHENFDYQLINSIVGTNIYNKNSKSICKNSFEILPQWNDIILWKEIKIPSEIIFYPYINNEKYFANSAYFCFFFKGNNRYEMGASCKINSYNAIEKVISEILNNIDISEKHNKITIDEASEFKDHKKFYTDNENFKNLSFLYENNEIISYENLSNFNKTPIGEILKIFQKDVGWRFYITDLTTDYSYKIDIYVVKIFSENMIPIWFWRKSISQIPYEKIRLKNFSKKFESQIPDFLHFFD